MFGKVQEVPQKRRLLPAESVWVSKLYGTGLRRTTAKVIISAAVPILFNHESERRGRKIRDAQDFQGGRPYALWQTGLA